MFSITIFTINATISALFRYFILDPKHYIRIFKKKMKKESTKCTHKTCEHCSKLSNPPNYTEDEYDYLAKGK